MGLRCLCRPDCGDQEGNSRPADLYNTGAQCLYDTAWDPLGAIKLDYSVVQAAAEGYIPLHGRVTATNVHRYLAFEMKCDYNAAGGYDDVVAVIGFAGGIWVAASRKPDSTTLYRLFIYDGTTSIAFSTNGISPSDFSYGTKYSVAIYWQDQDVGAGKGKVEIKVDDVAHDALGTETAAWLKNINVPYLVVGEDLGKAIDEKTIPYVKNIWFNDAGATPDNVFTSWPPYPVPQHPTAAVPDADGQYAEWKDGGGAAGSHDEWDDGVSHDADTTYNESTVNAGLKRQLSNLESVADIGMSPMWPILAVVTKVVAKVTAGTTGDPHVMVRDNGTDYTTQMTPADVTYNFGTYDRIDARMPNGGGVWTHARFDAFQAGMQRADGDRNVRCTAVYVIPVYQMPPPRSSGQVIG